LDRTPDRLEESAQSALNNNPQFDINLNNDRTDPQTLYNLQEKNAFNTNTDHRAQVSKEIIQISLHDTKEMSLQQAFKSHKPELTTTQSNSTQHKKEKTKEEL